MPIALKHDIWSHYDGNNFNDFPENQFIKVPAAQRNYAIYMQLKSGSYVKSAFKQIAPMIIKTLAVCSSK